MSLTTPDKDAMEQTTAQQKRLSNLSLLHYEQNEVHQLQVGTAGRGHLPVLVFQLHSSEIQLKVQFTGKNSDFVSLLLQLSVLFTLTPQHLLHKYL